MEILYNKFCWIYTGIYWNSCFILCICTGRFRNPSLRNTFDITKINPLYLKLAFVFVLVGWDKAGLVPLHVWLPDAHSQAPTPVSALLSGLILNIALYGILRYRNCNLVTRNCRFCVRIIYTIWRAFLVVGARLCTR